MPNLFTLVGKTAIVTGAGGGIGQAICRALYHAGARVAVTDIDLAAAAAVVNRLGPSCMAERLDVTDAEDVARAFDAIVGALGALDILVANAGLSTMNPVVSLSEEEWDRNMSVNAKGIFLTNREAVRRFIKESTPGVIVNMASLAGKVGAPFLAHYAASKFAVVGFTQALAREVAAHGIRVNAICPGYVRTGMQEREVIWEAKLRGMTQKEVREDYVRRTPLGRLEEPTDVADVVIFLASDAARFMTGQAINVTGGVCMW